MISAVYVNNRLADKAIVDGKVWKRPYPNGVKIGSNNYGVIGIGNKLWLSENLKEVIGTLGTDCFWYNNDRATYEPKGYGLLYPYSTICFGNEQMSDELENLLGIPGAWITAEYQQWWTIPFQIKAGHKYRVDKCHFTGGGKEGTTTMTSSKGPDASIVSSRVERFSTGIYNGEYVEYTATQDASYFGVYCGGAGTIKITDITDAWRIPTSADFTSMSSLVVSGSKLKDTRYWAQPGTNEFGFNAFPTGYRNADGTFTDNSSVLQSSTQVSAANCYRFDVVSNSIASSGKTTARSVRLVKDIAQEEPNVSPLSMFSLDDEGIE